MSRSDEFAAGQDYRGQHQPDPTGVPLHEAHKAFPDIYERPDLYRHGEQHYDRSLEVIHKRKDDPEGRVSVYRAVPHGVDKINPGDWVSPSKTYAAQHGMHPDDPSQDLPVLHKLVRAKHLRTDGNDVNEWGYYPD